VVQTAVLAIQIYVDGSIPVCFGNVFHSSCWSGDAGTVNQDIEAAKFLALNLEYRRNLVFIGDIGLARLRAREGLLKCSEGGSVDIADVDLGASFREGGCNRGSYTGSAGRH
jgi:hypothetical protein